MYYISALENNCALSVVKKRLGDSRRGAWAVKENVFARGS
jgi:hypothetical protein